jgi:hypothetical protein
MKKIYIVLIALLLMNGAIGQQKKPCVPCLPEGITFTTQSQIDSFQINYPNCTQIEGDVTIAGSDITNLNGLIALNAVGGSLSFGDIVIGFLGHYYAVGNSALTCLTGLDGLTSIGGNLYIYENDTLASLTGLDNLTFIGGNLVIGIIYWIGYVSGNKNLTDLSSLSNLTSIGGGLQIFYNTSLTSLTGLDNIDAGSITDLYIFENYFLSTCEIQSICDYLINPNGVAYIHNNASGCNTLYDVQNACEGIGVEFITSESALSFYPNPASTNITISTPAKGSLSILNLNGQQVITRQITEPKTQFNISALPSGVYVVKLVGEKGVQVGKIIKE